MLSDGTAEERTRLLPRPDGEGTGTYISFIHPCSSHILLSTSDHRHRAFLIARVLRILPEGVDNFLSVLYASEMTHRGRPNTFEEVRIELLEVGEDVRANKL